MAVIEKWYSQDLSKTVPTHMLGNLYYEDGNSTKLGVRIYQNGTPYALTGSASGYCICADGSTVPLVCTVTTESGTRNVIYTTLPPSAYNVLGLVSIVLKHTVNSVVTTLLSCGGVVVQTRTGNMTNPGQVVDDWTNQINAELQQFEDVIAKVDIATVAETQTYFGIA